MAGHKRIRSFQCMLVAVAILLVMIWLGRVYANGRTLTVRTNAPNAQVTLDGGRWTSVGPARVAAFEKIPFGRREVAVTQPEYEPFSQVVSVGWFSFSPELQANLKPLPVELTVRTNAGAEVFLNNVSAGRAGQDGTFVRPDVIPGDYEIGVSLAGYTSWRAQTHLSPPSRTLWANLQITQEKVREIEAKRAEVTRHIADARRAFAGRDYHGALGALNAALALNPENSEAKSMRDQVDQTLKILGGR
jgi:hypothetical protein